MDQKTREKIEKFKGLDFCEHEKWRIRCPECMWEVPAIFRKQHEEDVKQRLLKERALTGPHENVRLI